MKCVVGLCSLLVLAGCKSAPEAPLAAKSDTVCERYYPTGSNFATTRCFTADERRQQQQGVDDARNAIGSAARPAAGQ